MERIDCEKCLNGHFDDNDRIRCRLKKCQPDYQDMIEIRTALLDSFEKSYFNNNDEFIAHEYSNTYFTFKTCEYTIDVECKVIEWLSRVAVKGQPFRQEWRNKKFRKFIKTGINDFLGTEFTDGEIEIIYQKLGNSVRHDLTMKFIESGYK